MSTKQAGTMPLWSRGVDPAPRWTRVDFILVGGLTLVALALRLPGLNQGLWLDEILTLVNYARLPAGEIVRQLDTLNNHVLYSLSARFSIGLFGESAWSLRLPALVFGVATVPALYVLGRQIAPRPEAFLAALFLVLNYQHVWFSQNARGYTGLLLASLLATILFIRLTAGRSPSFKLILGYAIAAALATWFHLTAALVICAHFFIWLVLAGRSVYVGQARAAVPSLLALALAAVLTLALNAPILLQTNELLDLGKEGATVSRAPGIIWSLGEFRWGLQQTMPGGGAAVVVAVVVMLAGLVSYARQHAAIAAMLVLPTVITFAAVAGPNMLPFPRFFFNATGLFILLAVRGGFSLSSLCLPFLSPRVVLLLGISVALAGASRVPQAWKPKQDYAAAAAFLAEQRTPGDTIVCIADPAHFPLTVYHGIECERVVSVKHLQAIENQGQRIWLVYTIPRFGLERNPELQEKFLQSGEYLRVREFKGTVNGGDIHVLRKDNPDGAGRPNPQDPLREP